LYEQMTFEHILQRMLNRVPNNVDKREGSVIYDALAPAAWELAGMYAELDINMNLSFADTASGEYLTRRCAEFGVNRRPATKARRQGEFFTNQDMPFNVPLGSRFSIDNVNYVVVSQISTGVFTLECEQAGVIGNQKFGSLLPIQFISGLSRAELTDILVPGEDEESDDALRQRYYQAVNEPAFGGNVSDYKQKINVIDGVGGVKVFPVWNGGGTVKCSIIAADWNEPSQALIDEVQTIVDPTQNSGLGLGIAPIGHQVTITGVSGVSIDVETAVTLETGITIGQVQEQIEEVIEAYLLGLRQSWADDEQLIVRVALIDAAILTVPSIIDVSDTTLNGQSSNIILGQEEVPVLGSVIVYE
jgi:uncharacterized phage protein gp47/JayE